MKKTEKQLAYSRSWKAANKERVKDVFKTWRDKNREKEILRCRQWRADNPEKQQSSCSNWRNNNIEVARDNARQWRKLNRERSRINSQKWKARNPELNAHIRRACDARRRGALGSHTPDDIKEILSLQHNRCAYCRIELDSRFHIDHITAIARGGSNKRQNIQILCASCNHKKHDRDPLEFARSLGMLL